jgi:hypothetical protein
VLPRPAALLLLLALPACVEARAPGEPPACATEAECAKQYQQAVLRLQTCRRQTGYVKPGPGVSTECDVPQAEVTSLANALARFHKPKPDPSEADHGFDVPAAPPEKAPAPP